MATKRPALREHDRVTLSPHKSVIPAYDGKPWVLRDTVLTVSHLGGTGSKRNPWHAVVTDGTHFWHLEPDDVARVDSGTSHSTIKKILRSARAELTTWLNGHGYHHASAKRHVGRKIHQEPTSRPVFAEHERSHHITTSGRRALDRGQFALPPGPNETRRGVKGRLPIDTLKRARSALTRASMMRHRGHISARQLEEARHAVHRAWPSIHAAP